MSNIVALPVLLPLLTAILLAPLAGRGWRESALSLISGVVLLGVAALLVAATFDGTILVLRPGGWSPAAGIVWVVDALSAVMLTLTALTSLATLVYAPCGLRDRQESRYFYLLHQLVLTGINGSFVTGDFFNLFVFFEIMLLASFVLIALGGRAEQLNQSFPYVLINLVASALLLAGIGGIYGTAGTVNMAETSRRVAEGALPPVFWAAAALVLTVFAIKAALIPVFFWLPDAYPRSSIPVSAFFAGLLTKVGVYTLFRAVPLLTGSAPTGFHAVLLFVAAATMLIGVVGALGRGSIRQILSFHIISQVGYMVFGLALYTPLAVAAGIFYVVHHIIVKTALFLAGGIAERVGGSGVLGAVSGVARTHPWVAAAFFVPAMALAGLPPFSGFWGKFFLVVAGFQAGAWAATTIAIVVSLLTLASMMKIWTATFWGEVSGQSHPALGHDRGMLGAALGLAGLSVLIGLAVAPLFAYSERAADQLLRVEPYVQAVLGSGEPDPRLVSRETTR
jgi:multicomponent Na+:H+ antiporter subunit D